MSSEKDLAQQVADLSKYEAGFVTDIESDKAPKGLNEDIIRFISRKKNPKDVIVLLPPSRLRRFWLSRFGLNIWGAGQRQSP